MGEAQYVANVGLYAVSVQSAGALAGAVEGGCAPLKVSVEVDEQGEAGPAVTVTADWGWLEAKCEVLKQPTNQKQMCA